MYGEIKTLCKYIHHISVKGGKSGLQLVFACASSRFLQVDGAFNCTDNHSEGEIVQPENFMK